MAKSINDEIGCRTFVESLRAEHRQKKTLVSYTILALCARIETDINMPDVEMSITDEVIDRAKEELVESNRGSSKRNKSRGGSDTKGYEGKAARAIKKALKEFKWNSRPRTEVATSSEAKETERLASPKREKGRQL